jgi:hypothetical protein
MTPGPASPNDASRRARRLAPHLFASLLRAIAVLPATFVHVSAGLLTAALVASLILLALALPSLLVLLALTLPSLPSTLLVLLVMLLPLLILTLVRTLIAIRHKSSPGCLNGGNSRTAAGASL